MKFNKTELSILACHPSHDFNKEGILTIFEEQGGFFRNELVGVDRWCRLRGNLLFYFKSYDDCSDPAGLFILENFSLNSKATRYSPFSFTLVFEEGGTQILGASSYFDRACWMSVLERASFSYMRMQIDNLLHKISSSERINSISLESYRSTSGASVDLKKPPFLEMSMSCDNLRCDGDGVPPNARVSVYILKPPHSTWILYAQTEVQERTSNPTFLMTVAFRETDGVDLETRVCLIVCNVREKVSNTAIHLGKTMLTIKALADVGRTRLFLRAPEHHTVGFISLTGWMLHSESAVRQLNQHATPRHSISSRCSQSTRHRRTQSLPPKLGIECMAPNYDILSELYANPTVKTFRFHSGLGGDISVSEIMAEPFLCFRFPQQLLRLWINEEKLHQEEILSLGDLTADWNCQQMLLLNQHSTLINMYGIALDSLEANVQTGVNFRKSVEKEESCLEFSPINLHLQRLCATNDSLRRSEHYDTFTVGAFSANSLGYKKGGVLNMLQAGSSSYRPAIEDNVRLTEGIIDNLRRMRKEIILLLRLLLVSLRNKAAANLIHIMAELQEKIHLLMQLLDIPMVDKAITFFESIRILQDPPQALTFASRDYSYNSLSGYLNPEKTLDFELESPSVHDVFDKADHSKKSLEEVSHPSSLSYKAKLEEGLSEFCVNSCYKSTDEPEPWDLIQLNIKASLICLSSKIKHYCNKISQEKENDPSVIPASELLRGTKNVSFSNSRSEPPHANGSAVLTTPDVSPCEDDSGIDVERTSSEIEVVDCGSEGNLSLVEDKTLDLHLDKTEMTCRLPSQTRQSPTSKLTKNVSVESLSKNTNQTIDKARSLHLPTLRDSEVDDMLKETRPSMRKLRQAIDGLMRTARLTYSVCCLREAPEKREFNHSLKYRRRICFSQALTSTVAGLLTKIWCSHDENFLTLLLKLGPIVHFEVLLSCYRNDAGRLADMIVAVEDLGTVDFILVPSGVLSQNSSGQGNCERIKNIIPTPRVAGTRSSLRVILPVPEHLLSLFPNIKLDHPFDPPSFRITPVLFNIGINEEATLAAKFGKDSAQFKNNQDSFERLHKYYIKYKALFGTNEQKRNTLPGPKTVLKELVFQLHQEVLSPKRKNVAVIQLSSKICRVMGGIRFTSCKSAKDRTAMSVTLEEATILKEEFDLAQTELNSALKCFRVEGTRRTNCRKNTGSRNYAFSYLQTKLFPELYQAPPGSFGSNIT